MDPKKDQQTSHKHVHDQEPSNKRIDDYIDKAISDDDFSNISNIIEQSVETAIAFTRSGASALLAGLSQGLSKKPGNLPANKDPQLVAQKSRSPKTLGFFRDVSGLGTLFMGLGLLNEIVSFFLGGGFNMMDLSILAALTFLGSLLTGRLTQEKALMARFQRYRIEIGNSRVLPVTDFASAVGLSLKETQEDLLELIDRHYFPQARLVEKGKLFLLDRETYRTYKYHYLEDKKKGVIPQEDAPQPSPQEALKQEEASQDQRLEAVDGYIKTLAQQKDRIQKASFKEEVTQLIGILTSIKGQIQENPALISSMNKFVDYYTPTTIKLVDRYIDFEASPTGIANVQRSKANIEESIQTVNRAFKNLLNELFNDDLIDIRTEIDVMETLLTQDGLIQGDHDLHPLDPED